MSVCVILYQLMTMLPLLVRLLRCLLDLLVLRAVHARHLLGTRQRRTPDVGHGLSDRDVMPLIVHSNQRGLLWLDEWRRRWGSGRRRDGLGIRLCGRRLVLVFHIWVRIGGPVGVFESLCCDFLCSEESATWATGTSHGMFVTRLVQIWLGCICERENA